MFGPDYKAGCPSCSAIADGFDGIAVHLANHDVTLWAVSRAPLAKLQAYKQRMGWTFPWASSLGSDFNFDFNVSFTEEQQREGGIEYNYRRERPSAMRRRTAAARSRSPSSRPCPEPTWPTYTRDRPGMSAFVLEDGVVYHTYSTYARGLDGLWGMYQWLDRAPKGRNETGVWWRRHDEYDEIGHAMRDDRPVTMTKPRNAAALGAADWLCLAAAPTFAIMALLTGVLGGGPPDMLCSAAQDASPLSGMVPMYVLMSAFHSAPG